MAVNLKDILGRRWVRIVTVIVVILVAIRIALPYIVLHYINRSLSESPEYYGHVRDVQMSIWRGAYKLRDLTIEKRTASIPVPLFSASLIDLGLQWSQLIRGRLVGRIIIDSLEFNFISGPTKEQSQASPDSIMQAKLLRLVPFHLNDLIVDQGQIHYRDVHKNPHIDLAMTHITVLAENLTNSRELSNTLVATIEIHGNVMGDAVLGIHADVDPYEKEPTFKLTSQLTGLQLTRLNDFIRNYGKFDVKGGTMSLYTEFAAADGKIKGYLKPLFHDVKIIDWKEDAKQPLKLLWEAIVGVVSDIFTTNKPTNRIATVIPIEGNINAPHTNVFQVILNLLQNAFIRAIIPGLQGSVNLNQVK